MRSMLRNLFFTVALVFSAALPMNCHATTIPNSGPHWHFLDGFSDKDLLRLEDGSEWRAASPAEAYLSYSWRPGDRVVITPNYGLFTESSSYPFYLNNIDQDTSIRVSPVASPVHFGENSYWLFGINPALGHLTMVSGRGGLITWEISSSYSYILRNWEPNDHIVIGLYDGYLSCLSSYKHILINFNKADFVQARPH